MLGPAKSEWAVGMVVEGIGGTDGTGARGTGTVVAGAGGGGGGGGGLLEPEAPQCAML